MSIGILLHGCNGYMGRVISDTLRNSARSRIVCGVDINTAENFDYPVFSAPDQVSIPFDVIIDFSHYSAVHDIMRFAERTLKPIVIATTGLTEEHRSEYTALSSKVPVFVSANMSLGVNMLVKLAAKAAAGLCEAFDIEIVESHHRRKVDAPSGTALMIADSIRNSCSDDKRFVYDRHSVKQSRASDEIGIHSIRGGTIPGEHTVIFAGDEEVIEISHRAQSRNIFARGAIAAAEFIVGPPPGLYSMEDLLSD